MCKQPIFNNTAGIPFFIIMNRGKCTFVTKVKHAQDLGAIGAIIVDNNKGENPNDIVMADDGKGGFIHIPSMLISYKNGKIIESEILSNTNDKERTPISAFINFDIPHPSDHMKWDLY